MSLPEPQAVAERFARRGDADRYSLLRPEVCLRVQERQRAVLRLLRRLGITDLRELRLLEVGCGAGDNLLELVRMGFSPALLSGAELLPTRLQLARERLPQALTLHGGDASELTIAPDSLDIVFQSTVFSSLLDDAFQQQLADAMWRWVRPGGGVLWYDFTMDNPRNPHVRGVPLARVRQLFPQGRLHTQRLTLAPPLARLACCIHPALYTVLNTLTPLRTHRLAWIAKPA